MSVSTYPSIMIERLENEIKELKDRVHYAEGTAQANIDRANELQKALDKSEKQVRDKVRGPDMYKVKDGNYFRSDPNRVEGDYTGANWDGGDV